ncbi:ABC transporter ATP-binding protein [Aminipila terrae]|uniref:ABC transporter ATP-binding protein n=1 Tax=Aminipila terrae TaxID=2697030 RepID=UPI001FAD5414|nr:ABC transporter ATP-binding protein [Aminipila terrae]
MKEKKKRILDFAGKYKYLTYLGCILSGISSILVLVPFICIWKIAYEILKVLPDVTGASNLTYYGWVAVIFSLAGIFIYCAALMCTHIAAFRTARNMRSQALHHMLKLPMGYFDLNGTGKLRRIIDESSGQTETFLAHILPDLAGALVTPVAMLVMLLAFDWRMGIISLIPIVISVILMRQMMGNNMANAMKEYQNALEDMNNEAVEYVRGIPVVKTFGQTVFSFKNFYEAIIRYKRWAVNYTISLRVPMCNFTIAVNCVFALLIPAGVLLIGSTVNPEKFLSDFIFYCIFTPILTVVMNKVMFSSENLMLAKDAANRINSILEEEIQEQPADGDIKLPAGSDIEFHDVTFSYPGAERAAVEHLSFCIKEGTTVALVGPSGGGKTTVASLIPRFFDADLGEITIGGVDVKRIPIKELMNKVSFVFQNTNLFKISLFENIKFSKQNATKKQILSAATAAQCDEIFNKMPEGINTIVGSKGTYLSGGEAQRIALARAILKDSPIVLLDEATAFADPENEYKIQQAFEVLTKNKTVLIIAHRLSTVRHADQILVIENGHIKEKGNHEQLLSQEGLYYRMWEEYQTSIEWKVKEGTVNAL